MFYMTKVRHASENRRSRGDVLGQVVQRKKNIHSAIIQSFAQLEQNYGKQGMEIITDNTQLTVFGGFAPNSQSAEVLSKALREQTVLTVRFRRAEIKSQSLQMIGRPLMTVDELKVCKDSLLS